MLRIPFSIIVLTAASLAQTIPSTPGNARSVPGDPVLTVRDLCAASENQSASGDCTVVVSRQRFDDLLSIVAPGGPAAPGFRRSFAKTYAETLAFESAARKAGIDDSPQYREAVEWLRAKTLADLLRRRLEQDSKAVSDAEIGVYYRERIAQFEEVKLWRLVVPKTNFAVADKQKFEQDAQQMAAELRERAAKGEDLERLQKEAYEGLGFGGAPPAVDVGIRRRATLPAETVEDVFSLQPGGVSKVENETYSFVIYRVEGKWTLPPERVREEISREIARQKLERALKSITGSIRTEMDETYFGTALTQ